MNHHDIMVCGCDIAGNFELIILIIAELSISSESSGKVGGEFVVQLKLENLMRKKLLPANTVIEYLVYLVHSS